MKFLMLKYRIYPSAKQKARILRQLDICKCVYNELLELNIKTYRESGKGMSKFDFNKFLKGKYPEVHSQVLQNVSDRLAKAFQSFFFRVRDKSCKKKGFPRFRNKVSSITYPQSGFKLVFGKKLFCSKIGSIPIVLHRLPKGKLKTLTIKCNKAAQWFAILSCNVPLERDRHPHSEKRIGIDLGLENFATLSNGTIIENPRFLIKSEKRLKRLQRQLSKKKNGSENRQKAKFRLAKLHIKVSNQRTDFMHKISRAIVNQYGLIAVEKLNVNSMVKNHRLAKHIIDASWKNFISMLSYKAVICGGQIVEVNPRYTSRICNRCGHVLEDMSLSEREFKCPSCGFVCQRDLNASLNIQGRVGLTRTDTPEEIPPIPSSTGRQAESLNQELHAENKRLRNSRLETLYGKTGRMSLV